MTNADKLARIIELGSQGKFDDPEFIEWMKEMDPMRQPQYNMKLTFPMPSKEDKETK